MKAKDYKRKLRKEFKTLKCPSILKVFWFDNIFCLDPEYPEVDHAMFASVVDAQWKRLESQGLVYTKDKYDCENRGFSLYARVVEYWALLRNTKLQPPICLMIGQVDYGFGKTGHAWNGWIDSQGVWIFDQGSMLKANKAQNYYPRIGII